MRATCPDCGADGHVSAFFAEADGKRLAAVLAGMAPELGRATIGYLGLFKPGKTALRLPRAVKLAEELRALAEAGSVTNDERTGVRRPCSPATWATGIEQMLAQRAALTLPLKNHNYLRAIVFGLADQADAAAERQRETNARAGKHLAAGSEKSDHESPLVAELKFIERQHELGQLTGEEREAKRAQARAKYGASNG
ncbi:hypothetical protein ACFONC_11755 [Luteimonas soli]|uniref:Uncharacterized protein n=1 Tax=Luteimonas soli TaxID=1648966 RepID=A0ABV7XLU4_9GAMM